ncbi:hypothetical protein KUTeg_019914 [Tegillarca granosa]|uniref:Metalloendopeptidase n=1 Tax=Tegillarca granosa TaxID=220873 RepID=A0ABQ9EDZ0_TEGGR|nr:hypothetical protein KUTeg_019914 [Tegillarca granosa]
MTRYRKLDEAIYTFENQTCVKFQPKSDTLAQELGHNDYVFFYKGSGCWSYVGKIGGQQHLSLGPGCGSVNIAIHEMCHAIGMAHEQSRSDRDDYVTIMWENLIGKEGIFNKGSTYDVNEYDYESVMQYGLWAFSQNGKQVIHFKDKNLEFLANAGDGLTFYDAEDINANYECAKTCNNPPKCEHGGYINHVCKCTCPSGITGLRCETIITDNGCGGIVQVGLGGEQVITSPNYPENYNTGTLCRWLVQGPPGWYIRLTVEHLHLPDDGMALNRCYHWLEIRYNLLGQKGIKRCGDMVGHTYVTTADEMPNEMLIVFDSKFADDKAARKGFRLLVEPVGRGCRIDPCVYGVCKESTTDCNYKCICNRGFSGKHCDELIDDTDLECSFDYHTKCFMVNALADDFQWALNSGPTSTLGTGPDRAYRGTNYIYAEMSLPRKEGDKAVLVSNVKFPALNVYVEDAAVSNSTELIWTKSGNQGSRWIWANVSIDEYADLKIYIEAVRGADFDSDIAIDEILITNGKCSSQPSECLTTLKGTEYAGFINTTKGAYLKITAVTPTTNLHHGVIQGTQIKDGISVIFLTATMRSACIPSIGYDYRGKVSRTVDGFTCQRWDSQEPHSHSVTELDNDENYCRNIDKEKAPWCYTTNNNTKFDYCSIPKCLSPPENCARRIDGMDYFGTLNVTRSGRTCQRWDSQTPHTHSYQVLSDEENYCRNPGDESKPWCYTTDPDKRFELCDIPYCENSPCHSDPCKNGGTCSVDGTSYRCDCLKSYSGSNCETQLEIEPENCKRTGTGFDYKGKTNITQSGYTCQRWDSQTPHSHSKSSPDLIENYCRNPDGEPAPWCYTTDPSKRWEICNISDCDTPALECIMSVKGEDYYGTRNITVDGLQCQRWDSQSPHKHSYGYLSDQENYCRNPYGKESGPWCYTVTSTRWDYCIVQDNDRKTSSNLLHNRISTTKTNRKENCRRILYDA